MAATAFAAVVKKAAFAFALRTVWPPRRERRIAERETRVMSPSFERGRGEREERGEEMKESRVEDDDGSEMRYGGGECELVSLGEDLLAGEMAP